MTNPTWLIEADVSGIDSRALQAEIRHQGGRALVFKPNLSAPTPRDLLGAEEVPLDACALVYATHSVVEHVQRRRRWRPGAWCAFERLSCSVYYSHFGPYLLNQNYTLLPAAEAARHAKRLTKTLGVEGRLFLRPNSTRKCFKGGVVRGAALDVAMGSALGDPTSLVLVAEPREISREWRLVISAGRAVAGSLYAEAGSPKLEGGVPPEVSRFAEEVLLDVQWRPDPLFMLDVCESRGDLRVLELNAFSCSALYESPLEPVVAAANECASRIW